MRSFLRIVFCLTLLVAAAAPRAQSPQSRRRVRIVLVGDSTVTDDKGWGLGFRRLNAKGSVAVARLVADELRAHVPALASVLRPHAAPMAVVAPDGTGDYTTV